MRLLAPIGLAVLAVIVLVVIATSLGGSDSDGKRGGGGSQGAKSKKTDERFYVVEPGDSLSTIASKTGVSVDRLTQLNPDLDPQALISGQQVKLR
jgi:LysM repeat protein